MIFLLELVVNEENALQFGDGEVQSLGQRLDELRVLLFEPSFLHDVHGRVESFTHLEFSSLTISSEGSLWESLFHVVLSKIICNNSHATCQCRLIRDIFSYVMLIYEVAVLDRRDCYVYGKDHRFEERNAQICLICNAN